MIKTPLSTAIGGVGMYTKNSLIIGGKTEPPFDIASLFENGEQGFWFDPSDLSTMFQDAAGTVPVTGVGQPVGLMLDKSKGLALGSELITTLDLTTWTTVNSPEVTKNTFTTAATGGVKLDGVLQNGTWYKCIVELDSTVGVQLYGGQQVVTFPGIGRRTITLYYEASAAGFYFRNTSAGTTTIHSLSFESIAGNHAYQTTSAPRPILRQNANTGAYYLEFDGSDDFLQTSNIDFTSTDKVSLFAGVRKSSDAVLGYLLNLGNYETQQGVFHIRAPQANNAPQVALYAKGIAGAPAIAKSVPSGINFVLSGSADLATPEIKLKINAILASSTNSPLGTGNFGNYSLYMGRFNGTALPFNGHMYGLIGIGRLTTESETAALEKELAKRTGVTLS